MSDQQTVAEAEARMKLMGELCVAAAGFFRSAASVTVGATTTHLVVGTPEWERLLKAAAAVTE